MKTRIALLISCLIAMGSWAQDGINYKAIIKDNNGNLVTNELVQVQLLIIQGTTTLYSETHSPTTDDNGIILINIGEGTPISGSFELIDWGTYDHVLNVFVDIGNGLTNLGATQFKAVPYALSAANVTGLEAINEGNGKGWRLVGADPNNYGNIGVNAVDLSIKTSVSSEHGATGIFSVAMGGDNIASGDFSLALGGSNVASGDASTVFGGYNEASGFYATAFGGNTIALGSISTAFGISTIAESMGSTAIGRYNEGGGNPLVWVSSDPLFEIGNGSSDVNRNNALTVLKNGYTGIGTTNPLERLHVVNGKLRIGNETIEDGGTDILAFNCSLVPTVDGDDRLGGPNRKWLDVWAVDGTINTSDRRDKKNINELRYGLDEVLRMQPVSFNWKNKINVDTKLGLIAQNLQVLVPEVVKSHIWEVDKSTGQLIKKELDRLGVYYSDLVPVLIKAIQEQQKSIEDLQIENSEFRAELETLKSKY